MSKLLQPAKSPLKKILQNKGHTTIKCQEAAALKEKRKTPVRKDTHESEKSTLIAKPGCLNNYFCFNTKMKKTIYMLPIV